MSTAPPPARVRRIGEELCDPEIAAWRDRALQAWRCLNLDARYEEARLGGSVVSSTVPVALGVREDDRQFILGVSVARSEAAVHWRAFLESLRARGLRGVCHTRSEDEARTALDGLVAKYESTEPRFAAWAVEILPEGLAVLAHRKRLPTSNAAREPEQADQAPHSCRRALSIKSLRPAVGRARWMRPMASRRPWRGGGSGLRGGQLRPRHLPAGADEATPRDRVTHAA